MRRLCTSLLDSRIYICPLNGIVLIYRSNLVKLFDEIKSMIQTVRTVDRNRHEGNLAEMTGSGDAVSSYRRRRSALSVFAAITCTVFIAGCGSSSTGPESELSAGAPVALTPKRDPNEAGNNALIAAVDDAELRKAVERYRISKQRGESYTDTAGVDLNGDGQPEALVLFAGDDWCLETGCSLVVFQKENTGFRPVSHMTRVRPPVMIGPDTNFGWNDLIVSTGGGPAPIRTVRLGFTGKGYPGNALLQPEPDTETQARAQSVLVESRGFASFNLKYAQGTGR